MNDTKAYLVHVFSEAGVLDEQQKKLLSFYESLIEENKIQNLTRLTSPQEFIEGHFADVQKLRAFLAPQKTYMDLGSGCGVPGVIAAILYPETRWVLSESEGRKAEFLEKAVLACGLENCRVFRGRGESYLKEHSVDGVVARAVGPAIRLIRWLDPCSTWNSLILLKGPKWSEEWDEVQKSRFRSKYFLGNRANYSVGDPPKSRTIVNIQRVSRGTSK